MKKENRGSIPNNPNNSEYYEIGRKKGQSTKYKRI